MKKFVLLAAAAVAAPAFAQSQMKPGLWEITPKMQTASGQMEQQMAQMQQQMANMPPDQRKMMEQMMAQRGVRMGPAGGNGMTMKICMTKEQIERNQMPQQQRGDCKTSLQPKVGNTTKMSFTCTNPPSSGEGQYTVTSPDSYAMKMVVHTTVQGHPETMNMDGTGRWLGADCGDIKPIQAPAK